MAMDFFEHQQRARQRTSLLLVYFFLAVLLTVLAVNAVAFFGAQGFGRTGPDLLAWLQSRYAAWTTLATLSIIGGGSLFTWLRLRDGGHVLADSVGAQRIAPDTRNPQQRALLNIVEEMAIASGTPAPTVYVMENEAGINAFVAGFEPTEAVLVVTQGALDSFTRDEMQGVVGHEFSHILNGDMRMNVNLYAILSGILAIGRIGEFLMRNAGSGRSGGRNEKGGAIPVFVAGLALMVIGYIGLFFGRLIKAAISRQREWLADASSVQFTRNPQGIGEALLKIRNAAHGSLLDNAHAEDMSHMCFALPVKLHFQGLMATHPPLDERIHAIDPALLARDRARARSAALSGGTAAATPLQHLTNRDGSIAFAPVPQTATQATAMNVAGDAAGAFVASAAAPAIRASVGQPSTSHLAHANRLHASIPDPVRDALRTPDGACAVTCAIILAGTDAQYGQAGRELIARGGSEALATQVFALLPELQRMGTRLFLPSLDLALPALRTLSAERKSRFLALLASLTQLDQRLTLREYMVLSLMRKHLAADVGRVRPVRHRSYGHVGEPINTVISVLCHATGSSDEQRAALHARLLRGFGIGTPALVPAGRLNAAQLQAALAELADLTPLLKKPLLDACIDCVSHDGRLQVAEIELIRTIGDTLDCPIPPWAGGA